MRLQILAVALALISPEFARCESLPSGATRENVTQPQRRLFDSLATFAPYVGTLGFADGKDNYVVRALFGVTFDLFLYGASPEDRFLIESDTYYGFETGILNTTTETGSYVGLL